MESTNDQIKHSTATDGKPPVGSSYFRNCSGCGKITTKDRWVLKTEQSIRRNERPLCPTCGFWAETPIY